MFLSHDSSDDFLNEYSLNSEINIFENDKLFDFNSNPCITTESIHNLFSQPEFAFVFKSNNEHDDIDSFIYYFQNKLKSLYLNGAISEIMNVLETQFPNFFNINISFLFFVQKLKMLQMLKEGKVKEANLFYNQFLFRLLRESRPNQWKKKNKFFLLMLKKPCIYHQTNILEKYAEKFNVQLDNAIRNYINGNNNKNPVKNKNKENEINTDNINDSDSDIGNESTKDDFSDFEDEIEWKLCDMQNLENQENNNFIINEKHYYNYIKYFDNNNNTFEFNKLHNIDDTEINTSNSNKQNNINNKRDDNISSISTTNSNKNNKKFKSKKENIDDETLFKKLPILSSFKPKYAKRETIDKKIIRTFKQFIVDLYTNKQFDPNTSKDYSFYIILINKNILPPIDFIDVRTNEKVYFKSFNSNFLLWFFSKEGIKDLYNKFIVIEGDNFINSIVKYYEIMEEEKLQLINYVNNLPFIFDISLVNNLTNGKKFNHIYRKQNNVYHNNYHIKKKFQKNRSRDLDNESDLDKSSSSNEE